MLTKNERLAFEFREFEAIIITDRHARKPWPLRAVLHLWKSMVLGLAMYAASYHGIHLDMDDLVSFEDADRREIRIMAQEPFDY